MKLNMKLIRLSDGKEFFPTKIEANGFGVCNGSIQYIEFRESGSVGGEYEYVGFNLTRSKSKKKFETEYKLEYTIKQGDD